MTKKMGRSGPFFISGEDMELHSLLETTLSGLGYELVDLEIGDRGKLIRLFIDKPGGVNIDDCALVSNHVTRLLAVELDYDYSRLEVSSPGLDRPLKKESDFTRFVGETAQVKLRLPHDGRKKFVGVLKGWQDGCLLLEVDGNVMALDFSNVDKAKLVPRF